MHTWLAALRRLSSLNVPLRSPAKSLSALLALLMLGSSVAFAQPGSEAAGEASLRLPDLSSVSFLGMDGHKILLVGILFCFFGLLFGMAIYMQLKNLPVHRSMREISELIYETCKTYLVTQGKFILLLWAFIAVVILLYFGVLLHFEAFAGHRHSAVQRSRHRRQLRCGLVRHSREHLRQLAHCLRRAARQAVSDLCHSAEGRHEHRHDADLGRAADHALHPVVRSR